MHVVPVPTPGSSCCQLLLAARTSLGQSLSSPESAAAVVPSLLSNITSNLTLHLEVMLSLGPGPSAIASTTKLLQASYPCGPTFSLSSALKLPFICSSRLSLAPSTSPNLQALWWTSDQDWSEEHQSQQKVLAMKFFLHPRCARPVLTAALHSLVKNYISCNSNLKSRLGLRPGSPAKFLELRLPLKSPSLTVLLLEF